MSYLMRIVRLSTSICPNIGRKQQKLLINSLPIRCITTSKKSKDTVSLTEPMDEVRSNAYVDPRMPEHPKTWISWGFSDTDIYMDNTSMHLCSFLCFTVVIVGGIFIFYYFPDFKMYEWHKREAYLELRRREKSGLPPVDMNYVPVDSVDLPTDEELGDYEIII